MTYENAKARQSELEKKVTDTSAVLTTFPYGPMGLTPDSIKFSLEYMAAKADFTVAFTALREFNRRFVKIYAKEYRAERRNRKRDEE